MRRYKLLILSYACEPHSGSEYGVGWNVPVALAMRHNEYEVFVRILRGTNFAQNMDISMGHNIQFGDYCNIACNVHFGNNIQSQFRWKGRP